MDILYNLAFFIFGILYLPYFIVTRRYRYGLKERFGVLPERVKSICQKNKIIWVHAVSVGEMKAASILVPLLRKAFQSHIILFSTVTHTGNKVARTIATANEEVIYLPFDLSFIVDRVVRHIRPDMFLCLETELWPNLIHTLYKRGVKIFLVNGRISNRSYVRYKRVRFFISHVLKKFSLIFMQTDQDAVRILTLGAPREKVFVTGNLKFDLPLLNLDNKRIDLRKKMGLNENNILLIAGSTHRPEEEMLINCFLMLKNEYSNLRLLIAPRHIERVDEIEGLIAKVRFRPVRFSRLFMNQQLRITKEEGRGTKDEGRGTNYEGGRTKDEEGIFILDTIGELMSIYSASDMVFVGGSIVKKGGQNPIEPANLSRPIIFGKYMFNFQDVATAFIENKAAIEVESKEELYSAIRFLLDNVKERKKLGINARDTINKNTGSSQRTINLILSRLESAL